MTTFSEMIDRTRSRKISLIRVRSSKRLRFFNSLGSNVYEKAVDFFVESLTVGGVAYTLDISLSTNNTFKYDIATKKLTFKTNGSNPELGYTVPTFLHFFSNFPIILPYDFNTGGLVEFEPLIQDLSTIKLELDSENTGIALESDSNISLENNSGYFTNIFDTHIFENKKVEYYYYFENLPITEVKLSYRGLIQDKAYSNKTVRFNVKDMFLVLRDNLKLNLFDLTDGNYSDGLFLKPKRRIYGEVSKLKVEGVDKLKGSFTGSGTISGTLATTNLNGVGTSFFQDLCVGDTVEYVDSLGVTKSLGIQDITSNTLAVLSESIKADFTSVSYSIKTEVYSNKFNRRFNIAGHKLVELVQPITAVNDTASFNVANIDGFEIGSIVEINNKRYTIVRAYGNTLVVNQNVSPLPIITDTIFRLPCFKAYIGIKELVYKVDYEIENLTSNSTLVLYPNAEENIISPVITTVPLVFTVGSRVLTSTIGTKDLTTIFKSRDLIKPNNITYPTYYEVLSVTETEVKLRTIFTEASITIEGLHKNMGYVSDDSIVAVDCIGIGNLAGEWIRYPSEIVKHILEHDAGQIVDSSSFTESKSDAEFKVSLFYPDLIGNNSVTIKDAITTINKSIFGSLYYSSDYTFKYSVLNSNKPNVIKILLEHDVISYEAITKNRIINSAKITYKPHTDLVTGDLTTDILVGSSEFVDRLVGISKEGILDTILFNQSDAQIILNRYLFFNSLTNSLLKIKTKLNTLELNLNEPLKLDFDRGYKRYSGLDTSKIGIVNYIEKDESTCIIQVNDLGGIFNRVPAIGVNTLVDFSSSSVDDIAKYGFIVDTLNETPNANENYLGSNLIG
jgi:hypothetical protein